ncbi:MAG TPA: hypothetical protein VNN99_04265, partial [Vicinamibacterales bacterium]|nr:hypothetical protein [Vicinamibacterales bacterium]
HHDRLPGYLPVCTVAWLPGIVIASSATPPLKDSSSAHRRSGRVLTAVPDVRQENFTRVDEH